MSTLARMDEKYSWHERAEEYQTMADNSHDPLMRWSYMTMAAYCLKMGNRVPVAARYAARTESELTRQMEERELRQRPARGPSNDQ